MMSKGGQRADVANGLLHFGTEGGEVSQVEAPGGGELVTELLVGFLPGEAGTHGGLYNAPRGLWMREWPERCAWFPQLQRHHHQEDPERGGVRWGPVAAAESVSERRFDSSWAEQ
eukprot:1681217-Pyramimonas_sp.AAC.1